EAYGGGLFTDGVDVFVNDSVFTRLSANAGEAYGGAIAIDGGANLSLVNSTMGTNAASFGGGAVAVFDGKLGTSGSFFQFNSAGLASATDPNAAVGGAIYLADDPNAKMSMVNTRVQQSEAADSGGAIWMGDQANALVRESTFITNEAKGDGPGDGGGAIFNDGGTLLIEFSSFTDSFALGTNGSGGTIHSSGDGRVILRGSDVRNSMAEMSGGALAIVDGSALVEGSNIRGSMTLSGPGGAVSSTGTAVVDFVDSTIAQSQSAAEGGALFLGAMTTTTLGDTVVTQSIAAGPGGAIFAEDGAGLTIQGSSALIFAEASSAPGIASGDTTTGLGNIKLLGALVLDAAVVGGSRNDLLEGDVSGNRFFGEAGNDTLDGRGGDDTLSYASRIHNEGMQ
ncbi:MAG: hypothetical protein AAFW98_18240, partial [Pseudomonadota bacterium]